MSSLAVSFTNVNLLVYKYLLVLLSCLFQHLSRFWCVSLITAVSNLAPLNHSFHLFLSFRAYLFSCLFQILPSFTDSRVCIFVYFGSPSYYLVKWFRVLCLVWLKLTSNSLFLFTQVSIRCCKSGCTRLDATKSILF